MTDDAPTPPAPEAHAQESLQHLVNDTRQKLDELVATQKAARNHVTLATVAIVIIVLAFGAKAWFTARDNLGMDRLTAVANERMPGILENAQRALMQTQERVLPNYQDEAMRRMGKVMPQLLEASEAQLVDLPNAIGSDVESQLNAMLTNVRHAIEAKLQERFPYLSQQDIHDSLGDLEGYARMQAEAVQTRIVQLQMEETERVQAVLVKFPVQDGIESMEKGDLTRNFLKSSLEYALYEVEVSGTDEGLDWGRVGDFSAWQDKE
jgi:hypothetical protein